MTAQAISGQREALREGILSVAREMIIQQGTVAVSLDGLARKAGVAKPTLHLLFKSESDVLAALATSDIDLLERVVARYAGPPSLDRLLGIVRTVLEAQRSGSKLVVSAMSHDDVRQVLSADAAVSRRIQRLYEAVLELVRGATDRGEIDPTLGPTTVMILFASLVTTPLRPVAPGVGSAEAPVEELVGLFERAVAARARPPAPGPPELPLSVPAEELSRRETDVLRLIARGLGDRAIAEELHLAVSTVRMHVRNIYAKLGVNRRSQAVLLAQRIRFSES